MRMRRRNGGGRIGMMVGAAVALLVARKMLPELVRYLRIERM